MVEFPLLNLQGNVFNDSLQYLIYQAKTLLRPRHLNIFNIKVKDENSLPSSGTLPKVFNTLFFSSSEYIWENQVKLGTGKKETEKVPEIRLLLVDDNQYFLESLSYILHLKKDMEVVITNKRAHGTIDLIKTSKPDVVILDMMLPDMDGITLLGKIKDRYPDLPVIIMSAYEGFEARALRRGAYKYLVKGGSLETIYQAIRSAYEERIRDSD